MSSGLQNKLPGIPIERPPGVRIALQGGFGKRKITISGLYDGKLSGMEPFKHQKAHRSAFFIVSWYTVLAYMSIVATVRSEYCGRE